MEKDILSLVPEKEIENRVMLLQAELDACNLSGCLILNNINIFYYSGTMQNGMIFVPVSGDPVFFIRRSFERAKKESPLTKLAPFQRFKEIPKPLTPLVTTFRGSASTRSARRYICSRSSTRHCRLQYFQTSALSWQRYGP